MAGLTDEKAALVQMNHAMGKVVEQMERLALGAGMAGHALQKDFTEQIAHLHWVASSLFDTMPFDGRHRQGGGFAGGRYFGDMENEVLSGSSSRRPQSPRPTPVPYGAPGSPSQAMADRTTDTGMGRRRRIDEGFTRFFRDLWPQHAGRMLTTQLDRLTVGFKKLEESLPPLSEFAHSTVKSGVVYGGVALQSSSPDAFATLTGSFKLLAATMGTELVPIAAQASRGLQSAAHAFERMDPGLKKFYTNLFLVGTAAAGAIAALPRLIQLFKGLTTAAAIGLEGIKGAVSFASSHPRGAALGGAAAVGIGVGAAVYGYSAYTVNSIQEAYEKAHANRVNENALRTPARLKGTQFYQELEQYYEQSKDPEIAENRKGTRDRLYQKRISELNKKIQAEGKEVEWITSSPIRTIVYREKLQEHEANIQHYKTQIEEVQDTRRFLEQGPAAYEKYKREQDKQYGKVRDQAKMQGLGMLLDFQSRVQPSYFGIEDMGKKIQLEALGVSPLQEEIRRIQIQQLDVLLEIAGYSKDQAAELKRNSGLP